MTPGIRSFWIFRLWVRWLKRVINWWSERMERRLFAVFLFLIILPVGALGYFSSQQYAKSIERNTVAYLSQVSDTMISKLDDYMEDMKKISIIPSYVQAIMDGLKLSNRFYESAAVRQADLVEGASKDAVEGVLPSEELAMLQIRSQVESSIYFMNNIKQGTNTVYLFDRYGHAYYVLKSESVRSDLQAQYDNWQAAAKAAGGYPVLLSTQEVAGRAGAPQANRYVFTVVREIISTSYESLGMIAVDANIGVIEHIVKDLDSVTQGTTLIVDDEGRVVFDSEKKFLAQHLSRNELLQRAQGPDGSFHAHVNGEPVLTIYRESPLTGWKILIMIPQRELMQDANRNRNFTLLTAAAFMGIALLISLALTIALTRPMRSLVRTMKEVQSGNLDVLFPVKRRDEVGLVGSAFNRMVTRVKALVDDVYLEGQRKKEAELIALHNQINPHFIYNTLETIRMTAVIHDDTEVSTMAELLGKLLRYGIGGGTETVPLHREFEYLRMYVALLNYRYGNKFVLKLPDEGIDAEMPVMKMLFQPIVENAAYHGLDETIDRLHIEISFREEAGDRVFTVRDDGIGMTPDKLRALRRRLAQANLADSGNGIERRGIGLRNVHERLKLVYGEAYGLRVDSAPGAGTEVSIRLPAARSSQKMKGGPEIGQNRVGR